MIAEDLEFQISQYVDGTLSAAQMKYVDELVQSDAEAQKVLADYRRLNGQIAQLRSGPDVRWDRFADQISAHISTEIEKSDQPAVAGRIGFSMSRWRIAAAVLVAGTALIAGKFAMRSHPVVRPGPSSIVDVTGPQAEVAKGPAVQDITISPSPAVARSNRYGDSPIVQGTPRVEIQAMTAPSKPPTNSQPH